MRAVALAAVLAIVAAGCTFGTSMPTGAASATPDEASCAITPPVPSPAATEEPTATSEPFVPFTVNTWADNVLLRENPGYLFRQLTAMKQGSALVVMGQSQGGEWLLVQTSDHRSGWVFTKLVETEGRDMDRVPVVLPADLLVVRGRVSDERGGPISGIQFALVQGTAANAPRNDAMTDESGLFHAFMPPETSGTWWLSYTAIACESNIMDATCSFSPGEPHPKGVYIELPEAAGSIQEFVWK